MKQLLSPPSGTKQVVVLRPRLSVLLPSRTIVIITQESEH